MLETKSYKFYCGLGNRDLDLPEKYRACMQTFVEGYTEYRCVGLWKGVAEPSVVFETIDPDGSFNLEKAVEAASALCAVGKQESVMLTVQTLQVDFCSVVQAVK
jgi:hypothetical protein